MDNYTENKPISKELKQKIKSLLGPRGGTLLAKRYWLVKNRCKYREWPSPSKAYFISRFLKELEKHCKKTKVPCKELAKNLQVHSTTGKDYFNFTLIDKEKHQKLHHEERRKKRKEIFEQNIPVKCNTCGKHFPPTKEYWPVQKGLFGGISLGRCRACTYIAKKERRKDYE